MDYSTYIALAIYFLVMLAIGLFAYRNSTDDISGYILGGRNVSPQVTALSAGASDMSGWMLMGLPGAMFVQGYATIWIAIGLVIGALFNYLLVAPRLRIYTVEADDALTLPDFFSKRFGLENGAVRMISAAVIILFFTLYTSAGLVSGGKLFESAFGLDYQLGLLVTVGVVVAYTLLGGFLAVSMTDFVQGCIMFVALILVPYVAYTQFDGSADLLANARSTIDSISEMGDIGIVAIISSLAWGLGYFGQPHIIVRFMAIRSVKDIKIARHIGMSWMIVTIIGALATGLVGVAYVHKFGLTLKDPETIFIVFSQILFHPLVTGFLLAAILAAVMSTISSQLLVSSSSLTEDVYRALFNKNISDKQVVKIGRIGVFAVAAVATVIALDRSNSILDQVSKAWAGFGAAFGPLVLLSLFWHKMNHSSAIAGIVSGAVTVLLWIYLPVLPNGETLSSVVYEMIPGFIVSTIAIVLVSHFGRDPSHEVQQTFHDTREKLEQVR
ncbi:sodium/proline symporter PutP [Shewanella sp. C32]|uniref:Sodium/proline symporter n=1 Tax=Shewanella electrica TaxID=515560 RepID=A0ABT2FP61_9GAMM|nr:sodium/proline symporter PutP [Shewanella electrica]MCH1925619.1 sodium/proline symporter PutP [Shewanella electrica]MCS4558133.1 sodium/proline symporter PutP [Shewanella electrica]